MLIPLLRLVWEYRPAGRVARKLQTPAGTVSAGLPEWGEYGLSWKPQRREEAYLLILDNGMRVPVSREDFESVHIGDMWGAA